MEDSPRRVAAASLMLLYLLFTVVLLLNLLIALFAKTFDTMYETIDIIYQNLFATNVISYMVAPLLPPPLNGIQLLEDAASYITRAIAKQSSNYARLPEAPAMAEAPATMEAPAEELILLNATVEAPTEELNLLNDKEWTEDNIPSKDKEAVSGVSEPDASCADQ